MRTKIGIAMLSAAVGVAAWAEVSAEKPGSSAAQPPPGAEEEASITARLVANTTAVVPGRDLLLGVHLTMSDGWHTYWKNPGAAGLATDVTWQLPDGFRAGPLRWPVPIRFTSPGPITSFGYAGEVMLLTHIHAPEGLGDRTDVTLQAKVSWLGCKDVCVPGEATVGLTLPVAAKAEPANADLFRVWRERLPRPPGNDAHQVDVRIERSGHRQGGGTYTITLTWPAPVRDVQWFPDPGAALKVSDVKIATRGPSAVLSFAARPLKGVRLDRDTMESVVAYADGSGRRRGVRIDVPLVASKKPEPAGPDGVRPDGAP